MPKNKSDILEISDLHVNINNLKILKGINLTIKSGEIHAIMGPNGSGKSTLCNVLMGHPKYTVIKGSTKFNNKNILKLDTNERAKLGLFLGFQQPLEIPGVTFGNFLRLAKNIHLKATNRNAAAISPVQFIPIMKKTLQLLKMDEKFIGRSINEGFSGGEKKRAEIAQMAVLEPKIALLDEIDSGLDIDALKIVAYSIKNVFQKTNPGIMLITHYQRMLKYITPHFVHVMADGKIIKSGTKSLAKKLESKGYAAILHH